MKSAEALKKIRDLAAANLIRVTEHARKRMAQRSVRYRDLQHALSNARSCANDETAKWRVEGADLDGDDLTVIVVLAGDLLIITVF